MTTPDIQAFVAKQRIRLAWNQSIDPAALDIIAELVRVREAAEEAARLLDFKDGPVRCSYGNCQGALRLLNEALAGRGPGAQK